MLTKAPRGTKDILPQEVYKWRFVEQKFAEICRDFNYKEIRTPTFEHTELFQRGVGETTDIVKKEMYTFEDKGGRSITLKPEGTAPVVRAFIENNIYADQQPSKFFYIIPAFRYEKPQSGRLREFHQFGIEAFGSSDPAIDAEVIALAVNFFERLGIRGLKLHINSVGCPECRKEYNNALKEYLKPKLQELCSDCKIRYERNPMRVLDCKVDSEKLNDAPLMLDYLCDDCKTHFDRLKDYLEVLNIAYEIDPRIVRGLDYYTKTAFEIISENNNAQGTVCGGGRYDGLVKECGGPDMPGIGFGLGIERLLNVIDAYGIKIPDQPMLDVYIAPMGDEGKKIALKVLYTLRGMGISAESDYMGRSIKAQMKYADRLNARYAIVIGDDEIKNGIAAVKNMFDGSTVQITLDDEGIKSVKDIIGGRQDD
ncbi:MAG: histidine--tRNA ligase [Thermoanaerobacteraceae bacterium]|nr:histidine--tRNA ligase [Thermoanaerobacteraceae bacterium]